MLRAAAAAPLATLIALALAGCSTTTGAGSGGSVSATGNTLTIYAQAPAGSADPGQADVLDAEQLAFDSERPTVKSFGLRFARLTDPKLSNEARTAVNDASSIAMIGGLVPGDSADTIGITNALDLLQVSPTDTALELTQQSTVDPGSPDRYYEDIGAYGRTFARVVGTSAAEASALVHAIAARGTTTVTIAQDGSTYGKVLAAAFTSAAQGKLTIGSDGHALLLAMTDPAQAAAAAARYPSATPYAPSALYLPALAAKLPKLQVAVPGFLHPDAKFAGAFKARFGHEPDPRAVFGYEAMSAVLATLAKAGPGASNRTTVVHDFFAIKNRSSALGSYSIDQNGDTSLSQFVLAHVQGGSLVPYQRLTP